MEESNMKYNPKFSREEDPWDDGSWQTGSTRPPKDRGGTMALLLILIIFLCGIITVLGILNVRMFRQLNRREEAEMAISFTEDATTPMEDLLIPVEIPAVTEEVLEATLPPMISESGIPSVENVPEPGAMSLQDIYQKNISSVVSILCEGRGSSGGTGVIVSGDGYIVTNAHVVEGASDITVQLTDDRLFHADVVGSDTISDLAVLYIEAEGLVAAEFGDSEVLRVGDTVVAIGDPLGVDFRGTYTNGIVSAINRDVAVEGRTMTLIQTNAALNSGNSGGPLINCYGQVVGINTMKISTFTNRTGVEGLGFAIPSATVQDVVSQLIAQGYVSGRPTLGITGESLSLFYQHYYRLPAGLYITAVEPGSSAYAKGVESGDILISLNGTAVSTMDQLNALVYAHEVGDTLEAVVYRGGQQYKLELLLTEDKG